MAPDVLEIELKLGDIFIDSEDFQRLAKNIVIDIPLPEQMSLSDFETVENIGEAAEKNNEGTGRRFQKRKSNNISALNYKQQSFFCSNDFLATQMTIQEMNSLSCEMNSASMISFLVLEPEPLKTPVWFCRDDRSANSQIVFQSQYWTK